MPINHLSTSLLISASSSLNLCSLSLHHLQNLKATNVLVLLRECEHIVVLKRYFFYFLLLCDKPERLPTNWVNNRMLYPR